ncbi:MAG: hypothetical protein FWG60_04715 [Methanomassiliicoccaceae archaeon]|nr:hypothetical protein [Methanomassiliicoccaceae archaeon]
MSFFDDNKKVGLALIIVGLISIIVAVASIAVAYSDSIADKAAFAVSAIGSVIFGLLIMFFGFNVRKGSNDKVGILSGLFRVLGIATILGAIFTAISVAMIGDIGAGIVSAIIEIIIGLIYLWVSFKIAGGNKNVISKILWVILLVFTLILAILALIAFFVVFSGDLWLILAGISSLCSFFVYVYAFIALLSPEVKSSMGV